jgi:hypothetical protein
MIVSQLLPFLVHLLTAVVAVAVALVLATVHIFSDFNAPSFLGVLLLVGGLIIWILWKMAQLAGWTARKFNSRSQTLRNKMDKFPPAEDHHKRLEKMGFGFTPPQGFYYLTPRGKKAVLRVFLFRAFPLTYFWLRQRGWASELWVAPDDEPAR